MKVLLAALLAASPLWSRTALAQNNLFSDPKQKTIKVGDVVTVLIVEDAKAGEKAETDTHRESEVDDSLQLQTPSAPTGFGINLQGNHRNSGGGTTARSAFFTAKVSAIVEEVLPGGNLRIAGKQVVTVNHDEQRISLKGIVRPSDIGPQNQVYSYSLANAEISYEGTGVLAKRQRRGFLSFMFGWLF